MSLLSFRMLSLALMILVAAYNLHHTNAAWLKQREIDNIFFPGSIMGDANKFGTDDIPEECRDKTYCTIKPPSYPEEHFNKMFKGVKTLAQPTLVLESMLTNRQGDPDERDDCESEVKYEPLYNVRSKRDGEWRVVVQGPGEDYVQRVRLETCTNPDGPCFNVFPPTSDIKVFCKQKYNKWKVLVAKGDNETEKIEVDLPVCCSCQYKSAPIETRFGIPQAMTPAVKP